MEGTDTNAPPWPVKQLRLNDCTLRQLEKKTSEEDKNRQKAVVKHTHTHTRQLQKASAKGQQTKRYARFKTSFLYAYYYSCKTLEQTVLRTIKTTTTKKRQGLWAQWSGKKTYIHNEEEKKPFALARLHKLQRRRSMKNKHTHKKGVRGKTQLMRRCDQWTGKK